LAAILSLFPPFVSGLSQFRLKVVIRVAQLLKVVDFRESLHVTSAPLLAAAVSLLFRFVARCRKGFVFFLLLISSLAGGLAVNSVKGQVSAAPKIDQPTNSVAVTNGDTTPHFNVTSYVVQDNGLLPTNIWVPMLSKYTGTNVSLTDIVKATFELQAQYRDHGHPQASIAIAHEQIANGVVTLNIFQTAIPQVVVSGVRYYSPTNAAAPLTLPPLAPVLVPQTAAAAVAATPPPPAFPPLTAPVVPAKAATPAELALARAALSKKEFELDTEVPDTCIHVVSTNAGPRFVVRKYLIEGNTILTPHDLAMVLTNIDGAYGTNVSFDGVRAVVQQLQKAYRDGGYVTVAVGLPRQKLTNAEVTVKVTEGRLEDILAKGNNYFSSNNVMRALPSLHTNMILNAIVFQDELNSANANQDRQIYPVLGPGPDPGSSALTLNVKDQLPVHGKLDFNNQNSPDTPDLRLNASAVDDNLWQLEHQFGVQYGFSPTLYKQGPQWNFFDLPAVADYSTFYRLPLGGPEDVANTIETHPGSFGYDEATRQFNLPPPSGQRELNIYASRATIDTGVQTLSSETLTSGTNTLFRQSVQEGITINEDVGFQLSQPLPQFNGISSTLSGGLDYKYLSQENAQTNFSSITSSGGTGANGKPTTNISINITTAPLTRQIVNYLPLALNYNANWNDFLGPASASLGLSANLWFSSATYTNGLLQFTHLNAIQNITGSSLTTGHWVILKPGFTQTIFNGNNWQTVIHADGQWSSQPLISNEQYGIGGVNSVRGYHEGEAFGDNGWLFTMEEDTPPYLVGTVYGSQQLSVHASIYMDGAQVYLIDPQPTVASRTSLWSTGFGVGGAIGSHWQAQFLFSLPLISTTLVPRYNPYFNFELAAQF
jgi:hemolysin activation/secretion protein